VSGDHSHRPLALDNAIRIYAWFLLAVTALPALARLARPRELARIVLARYQNPKRRKRAFLGGVIYLGLSAVAIAFVVLAHMRQERWLIMAVLVGMVSAVEFVLNSRALSEDVLARQNRMFGGAYAALAIATILLIFTR
jgi:MFS family permease